MCVSSPGARPCGGSAMREIVTAPNATTSAWVAKGNAVPTAKSSAPIGGPASWLTVMKPVWSRALAIARSSRSTSMGSSVCEELSANTSAVPSTKRETRTTTIDTRSVTTASARSIRTTARTTSTVTTMRRRSSLSVRAPANNPNINGGNHWTVAASATRAGLLVSEATTSGPAAIAMPSPRLLTHDDASSHRKPVPRRAGATVSTSRLTTARWYPSGARRTRSFERAAADLRATQRRGGEPGPHEARAGDRRIDAAGAVVDAAVDAAGVGAVASCGVDPVDGTAPAEGAAVEGAAVKGAAVKGAAVKGAAVKGAAVEGAASAVGCALGSEVGDVVGLVLAEAVDEATRSATAS